MAVDTDYPRMRSIEAFPVQVSGRDMVCLRDPQKLGQGPVVVTPGAFFVISLFDGAHSVLDIQEAYMRRYGSLLFSDRVRGIIEQLDTHLLMESERFCRFRKELEDEFRQSEVREAFHAGEAYEREPDRLKAQCLGFFDAPQGPGQLPGNNASTDLKGVVAPHIDMARGGPCFAWAYHQVATSPAELYIIFGTVHTMTKHRFVLTRKHFATPLGQVQTDRDFVHELLSQCNTPFEADELVHRSEHSIEFQVVFLQALLGERRPFQIVPILCGGFQDMVEKGTSPSDDAQFEELVESVKRTVRRSGKRTCLIAGADLAHVGRRFGHPDRLSDGLLKTIEAQDREMLAFAARIDGDGFYQSAVKDGDRRNICGVPPICALLGTIEATGGSLLKYDQAVDQKTQSVVSFASMAFH